jgi:hypothetical protein
MTFESVKTGARHFDARRQFVDINQEGEEYSRDDAKEGCRSFVQN